MGFSPGQGRAGTKYSAGPGPGAWNRPGAQPADQRQIQGRHWDLGAGLHWPYLSSPSGRGEGGRQCPVRTAGSAWAYFAWFEASHVLGALF